MRLSKLDYSTLTEDEKYEIVMNGIKDLASDVATDDTKADLIVVLGCSPNPLEARVKKMMKLFENGYSKSVLLSGGDGWQKLYKKKNPITGEIIIDEPKRLELLEAIRRIIGADLLGNNPTKKEIELFDRFNAGMKEMMLESEVKSLEETQNSRMLKMNEAEFMKLIILTNGGLKGAKIFHEPFSYNTKENMQNTYALIESLTKRGELQKVDSMIVVTSSFHCRRAALTFKKQFPDLKIIPCPATLDMKRRGVALGRDMLNNDYYRQQIDKECNAMINYSRNGSIQDAELSELLPKNIMEAIEKRQENSISI